MATWGMLGFQDPGTVSMEFLYWFHDFSMFIMLSVVISICYILFFICFNKFTYLLFLDSNWLELLWTLAPMYLLCLMALPSVFILYMLEEFSNPLVSFKAVGHQWYWSYEYSDFDHNFDSYMIVKSEFRLLEVDHRVILPWRSCIRVFVSSMDVIHSWAMPSFGVKIDAVPGRVNQSLFKIIRSGLFYGQCSEICGMNHSFMPIVVESVSPSAFTSWLLSV